MAAHLSQAMPLGEDYAEIYRNAPQGYARDLNALWKRSPQHAIFKPGYQHDPYVGQQLAVLRDKRAHPASEGWYQDFGDLGMGAPEWKQGGANDFFDDGRAGAS